jgi:hypothetical protein
MSVSLLREVASGSRGAALDDAISTATTTVPACVIMTACGIEIYVVSTDSNVKLVRRACTIFPSAGARGTRTDDA